MSLSNAQFADLLASLTADLIAENITAEQFETQLEAGLDDWRGSLSNAQLAQRFADLIARIDGLILNAGAPPDSLGFVGSFAFDTEGKAFYGPKTEAGWGSASEVLQGADGPPGREVELRVSDGFIQWRLADEAWQNLVSIASLTGAPGEPGEPGADGDSAYEIAVANGFTGSEQEWLDSLKGDPGAGLATKGALDEESELPPSGNAVGDAYLIDGELWVWIGAEWQNTGTVRGPKGDPGDQGDPGEEITLRVSGSFIQWRLGDEAWQNLIALTDLEGPQGETGDEGPQGPKGDPGTTLASELTGVLPRASHDPSALFSDGHLRGQSLNLNNSTYDALIPSGTVVGFYHHSTGSAPSDSPTGGQSSVIHAGNTWGRGQIVLPNAGSQMFFRTGTATGWNEVWHTGNFNPASKANAVHGHAWSDLSGIPAFATRWPSWSEVTSKPSTFTPSAHTHPWSDLSGIPAFATRWPTWAEVTSKPSTFTPSAHTHPASDITGTLSDSQLPQTQSGKTFTGTVVLSRGLADGESIISFDVHRAFDIRRVGSNAGTANLCLNSQVGSNAWGVSHNGDEIVDFGTGGAVTFYKPLTAPSLSMETSGGETFVSNRRGNAGSTWNYGIGNLSGSGLVNNRSLFIAQVEQAAHFGVRTTPGGVTAQLRVNPSGDLFMTGRGVFSSHVETQGNRAARVAVGSQPNSGRILSGTGAPPTLSVGELYFQLG